MGNVEHILEWKGQEFRNNGDDTDGGNFLTIYFLFDFRLSLI